MVAGCFLQKLAGFLFAILFSSTVFAQEIGLELYSLREQFAKDAAGTMAKVKAMGFKEVELAGTYGLEFPEFIKLLAINELTVISYGGDYDKLKNFPQKLADEARAYGSKFVAVFWIPHDASKGFTAEDVDRAAEVFNAAGKVIARQGMALVYHPHGYEFQPYKDGTLFDYMVEKFDQRFVNFEMDVFWAKQAGQNPVDLLHKYKTRFLLLHLKDRKKGTKNSTNGEASVETNVVLGSGDVGIADVMKEAKENGIQHFFIEDESTRSEEQIPKSLKYLRSLH